MAGIVVITEQAINSPHSIVSLKLPLKAARATGRVVIDSELVTINGHINEFQQVINVKIASVAIAGSAVGNATFKYICK